MYCSVDWIWNGVSYLTLAKWNVVRFAECRHVRCHSTSSPSVLQINTCVCQQHTLLKSLWLCYVDLLGWSQVVLCGSLGMVTGCVMWVT